MTPSSFWRAKVRSRCASQPSSNWPLYLSAHSFGTWCGAWVAPGREVDEERLVRHQRLLLADPADAVVGQVLGEVIALLGRRRRLDRRRAVVQGRVPLVVLAADEPVELLEPAPAGRPRVERPHRRRLPHRHLVALAELRRRVAVQLQRHRQRRLGVRAQRAVARRRGRRLGDPAHPHRMVVAARQQRLPASARTAPSCGSGCSAARRRPAARRSACAHGPPNALDAPKPTSSSSTISTFGAPSGGSSGSIGGNAVSGSLAS